MKFLRPAQVSRFFETAGRHPEGDLWIIAVATASRLSELQGLPWDEVDLTAGKIRITRSLQRLDRQWIVQDPKTERSRRPVSLPQVAVEALRRQRARQDSWRSTSERCRRRSVKPVNPPAVTVKGSDRQTARTSKACVADLSISQSLPPASLQFRARGDVVDLMPSDLPPGHSWRASGCTRGTQEPTRSAPRLLLDRTPPSRPPAQESGAFRLTRHGRREPAAGGPSSLHEAVSGQ